MHSHPCFEALLILSGRRVQHGLDGDIEASEHSLVFIPPDVRHGATIIGPSSVLLLQFDLAFLCPELPVEASRHWAQAAASGKVPELLAFQAQPLVRFQASG